MTLKLIFMLLFLFMLTYSLIRPFTSLSSKFFLLMGSTLGILSLTEPGYVSNFAEFLGISGGGKDLYLYVSFVTIYLFIFYTAQRFRKLESKIINLTRQLALESVKKNNEQLPD